MSGANMPQNHRNGNVEKAEKYGHYVLHFEHFFFFLVGFKQRLQHRGCSLLETIRVPSCHLLFPERARVDHNIRSDTLTDRSLAGKE
jgi:hypothetical protein